MSAVGDGIAALVTVLEAVSGIETVYDHIPETMPEDSELPAILINLQPASIEQAHLSTREYVWAVDLNVMHAKRGSNIGESIVAVRDFVEPIIDALDAAGTANGAWAKAIRFRDPAISAEGGALGIIQADRTQYAGTTINIEMTVRRVGGFP